MEGLYFLMNEDASLLDSPEKRKFYQESQVGQQLQKAETDCAQLKKQLELSRQAWQDLQQLARKNPTLKTITDEEIRTRRNTISAQAWHYKLCLANSLCPRQCQMYGSCWKWAGQRLGEKNMRLMMENRVLESVCRAERDMILRCVGRHVASVVDGVSSLESYGGASCDLEEDLIDATSDLL